MSPNSYAAQGLALPPAKEAIGVGAGAAGPAEGVPVARRAAMTLRGEPMNLSQNATVVTVQNAIRSAEAGNTRDLFTLYRDSVLGGSHVQAEFNKRLLAVVSETPSILPADKKNPADVQAAECVRQAIEDCENFNSGCVHLLSSCLWPVSVVEKVFRPADDAALMRTPKVPMRFTLKRLEAVNPTLLCFIPDHTATDVEAAAVRQDWEPELRIYQTDAEGNVLMDTGSAYRPEQRIHMVHRGHLLAGIARDCYGGPARAVLGWWLLATLGRDWFARGMERYGSPFPVAKTNADDAAAVAFLQSALSLSTKLGGIVVDEATSIELAQAMQTNMAGGYETFLNCCNRAISTLIVGQTTSSEAQPTGLGSGVAKSQGQVREDIARFDRTTLAATLREQLFKWILRFNGLKGSPPNIVWGGLDPDEAKGLGALLVDLKNAGLQPTDNAIPTIGERMGIEVERMEPPAPAPGGFLGAFGGASLTALSASLRGNPPSDAVARDRAARLAQAFRGELAAVPVILSASGSAEEFQANLARYFANWKPGKVAAIVEEALQISAAAGAGQLPSKRP